MWFAGSTELQHPIVPSFRNWMDHIWILGEPSNSDCEHQRSNPNQYHQFGKTHFFRNTGRTLAGFNRKLKWQSNNFYCVCLVLPQALLSGGSSVLSIRSSVAFIPVSASALPGYRATPTINAKLPSDFFFPFVWTVHTGSTHQCTVTFTIHTGMWHSWQPELFVRSVTMWIMYIGYL